jgi:hypothetical protein
MNALITYKDGTATVIKDVQGVTRDKWDDTVTFEHQFYFERVQEGDTEIKGTDILKIELIF